MIGQETRIVKSNHRKLGEMIVDDERAIRDEASDVQVSVQTQLCPESEVQHKHLKETIRKEVVSPDVTKVVEGGGEHYYWIHVEYPTDNTIEQPHIRPAHAHAVQHKNRRLGELKAKYR